MKCINCDSIGGTGEDGCMIQECSDFQHLLYDKGGDNYGCRLRAYTIKRIIDLGGELHFGGGRYITGVDSNGVFIYRNPTKEEAVEDARVQREYNRIINRIKSSTNYKGGK